jgi:hypothetical protein
LIDHDHAWLLVLAAHRVPLQRLSFLVELRRIGLNIVVRSPRFGYVAQRDIALYRSGIPACRIAMTSTAGG